MITITEEFDVQVEEGKSAIFSISVSVFADAAQNLPNDFIDNAYYDSEACAVDNGEDNIYKFLRKAYILVQDYLLDKYTKENPIVVELFYNQDYRKVRYVPSEMLRPIVELRFQE